MKDWTYEGEAFKGPTESQVGFIYIITNLQSNRKYIGKKVFWNSKMLPKTKKRKRRKKVIKESDWRVYFGSCKELLEEVKEIGADAYSREIIYICETKSEMSYIEAREQFEREVLLTDEYYNRIIQCRINANQVGSMVN